MRENAQVICDESGAVLYYDGTIEDITERKRVEAALQEAEVRYRALVEQIPAIVYTDSAVQTGQTLYISPQVKTILGYDPQEWMANNNLWITIMHPDDRERVSAEYVSTNETGKPFSAEYRLIARDGRVVWMRDEAVLMRGQSGNPLFRQGILLDITRRRQVEETLRKSEQFLRQTIDLVPHFIFAKDLESRFLLVNKAVAGAYGTTTSDIVGKSDIDFSATPEQASHFHEDDVAVIQGGQPKFIPEEPITDAQGNTRYLQTTKIPFQFGPDNVPGILGVSVDITERKRAEEKIHSALEQKDTLLREVHHRVKNNLQAIISLMEMHAAQIEDAGTRQFLKELEEQARTMSLVYEQLYQSENLAQVDMALYLQKLASNVLEAFSGGRAIKLDLKIAPVSLDVAQAMPCGLIVNELLTNSLKYAFPPGFRGKPAIRIALKKDVKLYRLTVGDNGIGLPAGTDWQKGKALRPGSGQTLGLRLVHLWATHQLGGRLDRLNGPGTNYSLRFDV